MLPADHDDPFAQFKTTFFEECSELLADMETHLADLESGEYENETLHAIFRAVHSIKAGAGAFSFNRLVAFSHKFEYLLDEMRESRLDISEKLIETLFRSFDILSDLIDFAQNSEVPDDSFGEDALLAIQSFLGETTIEQAPTVGESTAGGSFDDGEDEVHHYRIEFTPHEAMYRHANEPLLIIRELKELGEVNTKIDMSRLPDLSVMEPEDAYFSWVFELWTTFSRDDVDEVFEFVVDDCDLTIITVDDSGHVTAVDVSLADDGDDDEGFGLFADDPPELDVPADASSPASAAEGPAETPANAAPSAAAGSSPVASSISPPASPEESGANAAASSGERTPAAATAGGGQGEAEPPAPTGTAAAPKGPGAPMAKAASIRVDVDRVDTLVNMVGELVITQAMLLQEIENSGLASTDRISTGMGEMSTHIRDLQENVMAIRMQPVKSVFSRMPRIVRDVSKKLEKKIKLITIGENTEVDKTVIEELADPLTHMIRNSLDHGLETPAERIAAGKSEEGSITLSAEHRGGRIVIEVIDDGRGINRDKVYKLAQEKGVIEKDAELSDQQIDNLIFAPGFSTADEITDLSGRGVGMDVVRRNIQSLGGRVSVHSTPGKGTRFLMTLPLTLAVLDGMIVGIGGQRYVIPINSILETVRPTPKQVDELVGGGIVVFIRGEYIRIVPVGKIFTLPGAISDPTNALVILVETEGGNVVGLLVDELHGQQQVVIKSLETNYKQVAGIASATILGNGNVCLIMDIDQLAKMRETGSNFEFNEGYGNHRLAAE
ncbi:MAG: chemotaxis protein CheA [Kordiimonadaceae bacterium]|nr:chemotaxis protein CheA [Kordiimonadaceae bacterium]MBL4791351.1 chemotaxis protein CheA [Kordiimonadaceae bacterium]